MLYKVTHVTVTLLRWISMLQLECRLNVTSNCSFWFCPVFLIYTTYKINQVNQLLDFRKRIWMEIFRCMFAFGWSKAHFEFCQNNFSRWVENGLMIRDNLLNTWLYHPIIRRFAGSSIFVKEYRWKYLYACSRSDD